MQTPLDPQGKDAVRPEALGFSEIPSASGPPDSTTRYYPLYLLEDLQGKTGKVYAFEAPLEFTEERQALPLNSLIDVGKVKLSVLGANKVGTLLESIKRFAPIPYKSTALKLGDGALGKGERKQSRSALGLMYLLHGALSSSDPVWEPIRQALPRERLSELGGALALRFTDAHLLSKVVTATLPRDSLGEIFEKIVGQQANRALKQQNEFVSLAARCGLSFEGLSDQAGLLSLNCGGDSSLDCKGFSARALRKIREEWKQECSDKQGRIPLQLVSMTDESRFQVIVDFEHPGKRRTTELLKEVLGYGRAVVSDTLSPGFGLEMTTASTLTEYWSTRARRLDPLSPGSSKQRARGETRTAMALRTGEIRFNTREYLREPFIRQVKSFKGVEEAERRRLLNGLGSEEPEIVADAERRTLELMIHAQSGVPGFSGGIRRNDRDTKGRAMREWSRLSEVLANDKAVQQLDRTLSLASEAGRPSNSAPAIVPPSIPEETSQACPAASPAAIVLSVDGLSPEVLEDAAAAGGIPTLKAHFLDQGLKFNSVSANTVSTAAWGLAWTGQQAVTKGSSTQSRDAKTKNDNLLSVSGDFRFVVAGQKKDQNQRKIGTRVYAELKENGAEFAFEAVPPEERCMGKAVVDEGAPLPWVKARNGLDRRSAAELLTGTFEAARLLDLANVDAVAEKIRKNPGKCGLVSLWLGSVDHAAHSGPYQVKESLKTVEEAFKRLLETTRKDCRLNRARIFLISDHGLAPSIRNRIIRADGTQGTYLPTEFNLAQYFLGQYATEDGRKASPFNPGSFSIESSIPLEQQSASGLIASVLKANQFVKRSTYKAGKGGMPILLDSYGNNRATITFRVPEGVPITQRKSLHELSSLKVPGLEKPVNLLDSLLDFRMKNFGAINRDQATRRALLEATGGGRPVGALAIALQGPEARSFVRTLVPDLPEGATIRDPVLVRGPGGKASIILTLDGGPETLYRYLVLGPGFHQTPDGQFHGALSERSQTDQSDDPLELGSSDSWRSMREWAKDTLGPPDETDNSTQTIAVPGIAELMTLSPEYSGKPENLAKIPDLLVLPPIRGPYAHFNPHQNNLGNHGGFYRSEVVNSFYVTCPEAQRHQTAPEPVLLTDFAAMLKSALTGESLTTGAREASSRIDAFCASQNPASSSRRLKDSTGDAGETVSGAAPSTAPAW